MVQCIKMCFALHILYTLVVLYVLACISFFLSSYTKSVVFHGKGLYQHRLGILMEKFC